MRQDGFGQNAKLPTLRVSGLEPGVTAMCVGGIHTCALLGTGSAKCWGWNGFGQLGDGSTTDSLVPVQVSGLESRVTAIFATYFHSCAVVGGAAMCWGANEYGQLGDGTSDDSSVPVQVSGLT